MVIKVGGVVINAGRGYKSWRHGYLHNGRCFVLREWVVNYVEVVCVGAKSS